MPLHLDIYDLKRLIEEHIEYAQKQKKKLKRSNPAMHDYWQGRLAGLFTLRSALDAKDSFDVLREESQYQLDCEAHARGEIDMDHPYSPPRRK